MITPSRGTMWTAFFSAALLGCLGPWVALDAAAYTAKGVGVVTALRGEAAVAHAPEVATRERRATQERLKFRDDVFFRDVIDTQRESTARLLLKGQSTLTIRELSRVELREGVVPADPTKTLSIVSLLAGKLRAIVARDLMRGDEMELRSPNAIAAVRGTDVLWLFQAGRTIGVVLAGLLEAFNPTQVPPPPTVVTVPQGFMVTIDGTNAPVVAPASTAFIEQLLADLQLALVTPDTPADEEKKKAHWNLAAAWGAGFYGWGFGVPQGCSPVACVTSGSGVIGVTGLANAPPTFVSAFFLTDYFLSSLDIPMFDGFLAGPFGGPFTSSLTAQTSPSAGSGSGKAFVQVTGFFQGWPPRGFLTFTLTGTGSSFPPIQQATFSGPVTYNGRSLTGSFSGNFRADVCGDNCIVNGTLSGRIQAR